MRTAGRTWAVVVGIDTYDHVPHLTGAARDACDAVAWLRELGVPDPQILLHAAPSDANRPIVDALGLAPAGCTQPEIWKSFRALIDETGGGERLFVFLFGHGFFEPGGHRVFLTREFDQTEKMNLGIEWYARVLRGLPYKRQFIFVDGCLNYAYSQSQRQELKPGEHQAYTPNPPIADVTQWYVYSASQGQVALEHEGRGVFTRSLFEAFDLDHPHPGCTDVDDEEGVFLLDLNRAVHDVVRPVVTEAAARSGRTQEPGMALFSAGSSARVVPVAEVSSRPPARLQIVVRPAAALSDVASVRVWSDETSWQGRAPVPPATVVESPVRHVLPSGLSVTALCAVKQGKAWVQPGPQMVVADADREIVFDLERPGRADARSVAVNTVDSKGLVAPEMTHAAYDAIDLYLADDVGAGVLEVERHETGPVLISTTADTRRLHQRALGVARIVNGQTGPEVGVRVEHGDRPSGAAIVDARISAAHAAHLAGLLQEEPVVTIGDQILSPRDLAEFGAFQVDAGPTRVEVSLPWGTWSELIHLDPGEAHRIELPKTIGRPPLRVQLLSSLGTRIGYDGPPRSVCSVSKTPLTGVMVDAEGMPLSEIRPLTGEPPSAWDVPLSAPRGSRRDGREWRVFASVGTGRKAFRFPLNELGPVALRRRPWGWAEALSAHASRQWDELVATGMLERISADDAEVLTDEKWGHPLLGLAGAYACFAHRQDEYLDRVLENLRWLEPELPDLDVLRAAVDERSGRRSAEVRDALRELDVSGGVPVFRWGIGLGVVGAHHYGLGNLEARLTAIERTLVATSTWTLWRAAEPG